MMNNGGRLKSVLLFLIACSITFSMGCSTSGQFFTPEKSALYINDRPFIVGPTGKIKTRPFFWSAAGGIPYRIEKDGAVIQTGKLPSRFRVASIFWPPFAIIYWPIGLRTDMIYDLNNDPTAQRYAPAQNTVLTPQTAPVPPTQ
ncbi:MAG: hypothetical protein AABY61_03950 [Nitrospirota bacterium]|jgi:hypothetical protein